MHLPGGDETELRPAYHVVAGLAAAAGRPALSARSSDTSAVAALAFEASAGPELWCATNTIFCDSSKSSTLTDQGRACRLATLTAVPRTVALRAAGTPIAARAVRNLDCQQTANITVLILRRTSS